MVGLHDRNDNEHKIKNLLDQGRMRCDSGDLQEALVCLDEVIELDSFSCEAFYIIGNVFHKNGEISKAIRAFSKVLELEPGYTDAAIALSVLYNDIGKYEEAREIFESAYAGVKNLRGCNNNDVLLEKAAPIKKQGDPHINKKFAYKHYEIADLYWSYGRYDDALFEYNKTVALDPNNLEARVKIGKVYAKKGFISKASEELNRIKREYPSHYPARIALGALYFSQSKVIEAQMEWQKVLSLDPKNQEAKMYLKISESSTETTLN